MGRIPSLSEEHGAEEQRLVGWQQLRIPAAKMGFRGGGLFPNRGWVAWIPVTSWTRRRSIGQVLR